MNLLDKLSYIALPFLGIYFSCMFIYPLWFEKGDWWDTQKVWHSWQALNASMLAFTSTIIAFHIARHNETTQRERNFHAAKAFLPQALSELSKYFLSCAKLLEEAQVRVDNKTRNLPLQTSLPVLPTLYQDVFKQCISYSEPKVAEHLTYILRQLQIHDSRITELYERFDESNDLNRVRKQVILSINITDYFYYLGELQALVHKTFEFARGMNELENNVLILSDFRNAYYILEIPDETYQVLLEYTENRLLLDIKNAEKKLR